SGAHVAQHGHRRDQCAAPSARPDMMRRVGWKRILSSCGTREVGPRPRCSGGTGDVVVPVVTSGYPNPKRLGIIGNANLLVTIVRSNARPQPLRNSELRRTSESSRATAMDYLPSNTDPSDEISLSSGTLSKKST